MRRLMLLATVALLLVAGPIPAVWAQGTQEATPAPSPASTIAALTEQVQRGEVCAWPVEVSTNALNIAYPDANASYFIMLYMLAPGQSLVVKGTYPFARFSSLTTYVGVRSGGHGIDVLDSLRDSQIEPDPGSTNPAIDPNASTDPAQRRWTVRVTGTAPVGATPSAAIATASPAAGQNVIVAHPAGVANALGTLILRVYVPNDPADPMGGVDLPALSLEHADGSSRSLPDCTAQERPVWTEAIRQIAARNVAVAPRLPLPPSPDAAPQWVQSRVPGLGPNPDNRYLLAPIAWSPGRVVVVRGKAPTFPNTRAGDSPATLTQVRYWSFCTGANIITYPLLYPTTACVGDFQIPTTSDGAYTLAISQPADRPANATTEQGVTWLQGSDPAQPDVLGLRHMLPSEEFFGQSVWAVPEGVVGAAETIMGPYYPQIVYCDKATFEAGGADACFAAAGPGTPMATPGA